MIQLSYSSLNLLHTCPHNWLNKQMGIKAEEKPEWAEGKKCHAIIQAHVSGKKKDKRLKHIEYTFPIVEEKEFDERCRFEEMIYPDGKKGYKIIGFLDGLDKENKRLLEIKTSSSPWSMGKFVDSMQRKLYAWAFPYFKEAFLITGQRKPELWKDNPPKVYKVPLTKKDRQEATMWIGEGVKILEAGNFTSDLVDGKCVDRWCYWGANCQFK